MTGLSKNVTGGLREKLLKDQERRAEKERRLSFAKKLRILDRMMQDGFRLESYSREQEVEARR